MRLITTFFTFLVSFSLCAQTPFGEVIGHTYITQDSAGFHGKLATNAIFAAEIIPIGDLNDDGTVDLLVNDYFLDDGTGRLWVLFMNDDLTVKDFHKIDSEDEKLAGKLDLGDRFGCAIECIGDLDGDGRNEIAVGAWGDDNNERAGDWNNSGAIWILYLNAHGSIKKTAKITNENGTHLDFEPNALFGACISLVEKSENSTTLAIGAPCYDDDGGKYLGSVWIVKIDNNATVTSADIINQQYGNLDINLADDDRFGSEVKNIGDLNNDGVNDLAVSLKGDDVKSATGNIRTYLLLMDSESSVKETVLLKPSFPEADENYSPGFGANITSYPDLNNDGVIDLLTGSYHYSGDSEKQGALHIMFMNSDGTIQKTEQIHSGHGTLPIFNAFHNFGLESEYLGDLNNDGYPEFGIHGKSKEGFDGFYIVTLYDGTHNIEGKVIADDVIVDECTIEFYDETNQLLFTYDTKGEFKIEDVPAGKYYVKVQPSDADKELYTTGGYSKMLTVYGNIINYHLYLTPKTNSIQQDENIVLSPLPASDKLYITQLPSKIKSATIISSNGNKHVAQIAQESKRAIVEFSDLPPGVYTISILFTDGSTVSRNIIRK